MEGCYWHRGGLINHKTTVWWGWGSPGMGFSFQVVTGTRCAYIFLGRLNYWGKKMVWEEKIILLGMFSVCFSPALVGRQVIMGIKSSYLYPSGSAIFYVSESHTDKWIHYRLSTSNKTPWMNAQLLFEFPFSLGLHLPIHFYFKSLRPGKECCW